VCNTQQNMKFIVMGMSVVGDRGQRRARHGELGNWRRGGLNRTQPPFLSILATARPEIWYFLAACLGRGGPEETIAMYMACSTLTPAGFVSHPGKFLEPHVVDLAGSKERNFRNRSNVTRNRDLGRAENFGGRA
jgi:hypothetical protein